MGGGQDLRGRHRGPSQPTPRRMCRPTALSLGPAARGRAAMLLGHRATCMPLRPTARGTRDFRPAAWGELGGVPLREGAAPRPAGDPMGWPPFLGALKALYARPSLHPRVRGAGNPGVPCRRNVISRDESTRESAAPGSAALISTPRGWRQTRPRAISTAWGSGAPALELIGGPSRARVGHPGRPNPPAPSGWNKAVPAPTAE